MNYYHSFLIRLERIALYLFIFLLPFNIQKYIGTLGAFNFNFESVFISLSDILVAILLILLLINHEDLLNKYLLKKYSIIFFAFLTSTFLVFLKHTLVNKELFFYYFFGLFLSFSIFLIARIALKEKVIKLGNIFKILILSLLVQAFIISGQFYFQKNILSKFVGESYISSNINNVAKINLENYKIIRGYGTFAHPNVAGAFFMLAILFLFIKTNYLKLVDTKKLVIFILILTILSIGAFLTFSRLALILIFLSSLVYLIILKHYKILAYFVLIYLSLFFVLFQGFQARVQYDFGNNFNLRGFLNEVSINSIKANPILGVGLGNFTENIKYYVKTDNLEPFMFEPVPNIYLLILAETGAFGFLLFLLFIFYAIKKIRLDFRNPYNLGFLLIIINFLILGLSDHYFITSGQGRYLFFLTLGLII